MWAFIDHSGKVREVQDCDFVSDFQEGWCVVRFRGTQGIMDRGFHRRTFDSIDLITGFRGGYSAAKAGRMYGYINLDGDWVIRPEFTHAQSLSGGYAFAYKGRRSFVFDEHLELVHELADGEVEWYSEGLFNVVLHGEHFFLDESFASRHGPYTSASPFYGGRALVAKGDQEYFIDTDGQKIIEMPGVRSRGIPSEGFYVFSDASAKYGYFDSAGTIRIAPEYDDALGFSDGLAAVRVGEEWFYINKIGKRCSEGYDKAWCFSEGIAPVLRDGCCYYVDPRFRPQFDSEFQLAMEFSEGLGRVRKKALCSNKTAPTA
ncbi:MAG: WG repeat-containing protein [Verrucomicrobiae bacterium]|nr:WG repeat-containing protein [Verrucomicrobiae bacterium]